MRHLLRNKGAHTMVNDSRSPIPQVKYKNKGYITRDIKRAYRTRPLNHITGQLIKLTLHAVDNNILHNLPILREDVRMAEDIYGPSIQHLKVKTVWCKIKHVDPVNIPSVPKTILDNYKEVIIFCDLMYINGIGFLNTISQHIMFATGSMVKIEKLRTLQMGSRSYISYTCSVASRLHT